MRLRSALAVCALACAAMVPGAIGAGAAAPTTPPSTPTSTPPTVPPKSDCPGAGDPGPPLGSVPWYATQLNLTSLSQVNQGQYVSSGVAHGQPYQAGEGVPVAVIDSGLVTTLVGGGANPIFQGADIAKTHQIEGWQYFDCVGHGTAVASLIVGQPGQTRLVGIAPRVHLIPIQYTNMDKDGSSKDLEAALQFAIAQRPRVINLSLQLKNKPGPAIMRELRTAERDRIVIVTAAGNQNSNGDAPVYPAALTPEMNNIIAVTSVGSNGLASSFDIKGSYVTVAAPGQVPAARLEGGTKAMGGTSFATPLVTGTVALMLATHPDLTPVEVRNRLEATAAPPPGTQPNSAYGWGAINPLAAVTSESDDLVSAPTPTPGPPLAAPRPAVAPDRTLEHRALAIALVLLGLAALTVTGAAVVRGQRPTQARRG